MGLVPALPQEPEPRRLRPARRRQRVRPPGDEGLLPLLGQRRHRLAPAEPQPVEGLHHRRKLRRARRRAKCQAGGQMQAPSAEAPRGQCTAKGEPELSDKMSGWWPGAGDGINHMPFATLLLSAQIAEWQKACDLCHQNCDPWGTE